MYVLTIALQKGGTGKTTTAHAIGQALGRMGRRVLMIDLDGQGNLSATMGAQAGTPTAYDVLTGKAKASDAIQTTAQGDIIRADGALRDLESVLNETGREFKLAEALQGISGSYDYAIIDTPPAAGILITNALTASDGIVIAAQSDVYSLQGIEQIVRTVGSVQKYTNPKLRILGIVLVRWNGRVVLNKQIAELMADRAENLGTVLYTTKVRECAAIREAQAVTSSIFEHAPRSNAAKDYTALTKEILEQTEGKS